MLRVLNTRPSREPGRLCAQGIHRCLHRRREAMIESYARDVMQRIWSEAAKYEVWLQVEVAACEAYARRGRIPPDTMARIRAARVDIERISEIERRVQHEVIALLTSLEEQLGADSRFVHLGLTS